MASKKKKKKSAKKKAPSKKSSKKACTVCRKSGHNERSHRKGAKRRDEIE